MTHPRVLLPEVAIKVSGYPAGQVLAIETNGRVAGAVIDTNSDSRWIEFDTFWFDEAIGSWTPGQTCGAGSFVSASGETSYILGRHTPGATRCVTYRGITHHVVTSTSGWWLYVWEDPDWVTAAAPELVPC